MKIIDTKNAPAALGPYCQAVDTGNQLYISGILGIDPSTGNLASDSIQGQTQQVFKNIDAILSASGYSKQSVVKCTVFLADLNDFAACNKIYADYFVNHKPARACVQVAGMVKNAKVEIDVVCVK